MAKKALIIDGFVTNVVQADQLAGSFHPDVAALFESVPDDVAEGSRLVDGVWLQPDPTSGH